VEVNNQKVMEGQYKNALFRLSFKKMKAVGLPPECFHMLGLLLALPKHPGVALKTVNS
jgi:hypothetical protein